MNQIIQSYLDAHIKEYEIESYDQSTAFEHFINKMRYSVIRKIFHEL